MQNSEQKVVGIDAEYDQFVRKLADEGSELTVKNSSESHALSILRAIFANAKESIYIYSDRLSQKVYNDPQLVESLKEFVAKGNIRTLKVLVRDEVDGASTGSNLFFKTLKSQDAESGLLKRMEAGNPLKSFNNFVVSDNRMFRLEVDADKANAYCSFNNPELSQKLVSIFDGSFSLSTNL